MEAERRDVIRQQQVVVDGLGNVHHTECALAGFEEPPSGVGRAVAADADQFVDAERDQGLHGRLELVLTDGIGSIDADERTAAKVDGPDVVDGQLRRVVLVAVHDPAEAVPEPDHLEAGQARANGRRSDHAVDAGGGSARRENSKFAFSHLRLDVIMHPFWDSTNRWRSLADAPPSCKGGAGGPTDVPIQSSPKTVLDGPLGVQRVYRQEIDLRASVFGDRFCGVTTHPMFRGCSTEFRYSFSTSGRYQRAACRKRAARWRIPVGQSVVVSG